MQHVDWSKVNARSLSLTLSLSLSLSLSLEFWSQTSMQYRTTGVTHQKNLNQIQSHCTAHWHLFGPSWHHRLNYRLHRDRLLPDLRHCNFHQQKQPNNCQKWDSQWKVFLLNHQSTVSVLKTNCLWQNDVTINVIMLTLDTAYSSSTEIAQASGGLWWYGTTALWNTYWVAGTLHILDANWSGSSKSTKSNSA